MEEKGEIVGEYMPESFAREYAEINGSCQYPMFCAVALGIKRSFDDWVSVEKYEEFLTACRKYGMHAEPDIVFSQPVLAKNDIVGSKNITTTFSEGKPFTGMEKGAKVHVFVSKSKEDALNAKKFGWYSVITGKRTINKPFVDHLRFGLLLGFPECCVDFFRRFNNWGIYSHPYETYKNTPEPSSGPRGSYLCNNFLMDKTFFLIHNLPCSYRCSRTMRFAARLEAELGKREPGFIREVKRLLNMPLLVFGEKNFVIFDGKASDKRIEYSNYEYFSNHAREEEKISFAEDIGKGDSVELGPDKLIIRKSGRELKNIRAEQGWFVIGWG